MRSRAGMTLLELVVALTVTGILLAGGYAAFASVVDRRHAAAEAVDAVARGAAVRRRLASWLSGARLTVEEGGPQFQGLDADADGRADDRLTFLTTAPTPLDTREAVVTLYIDRDETTPERGLVAEFTPWPPAASGGRIELERRAAGLDLRYLSGVPGRREWMPSWISTSVLPAGVALAVEAPPGDTLPLLLRLPIRVPIGAGR